MNSSKKYSRPGATKDLSAFPRWGCFILALVGFASFVLFCVLAFIVVADWDQREYYLDDAVDTPVGIVR